MLEVLSVLKRLPTAHSGVHDLDLRAITAPEMFLQDLRIGLLLSHVRADRERVAEDQDTDRARRLLETDFDVAMAMAVCDCRYPCLIMTDTARLEPVSGVWVCLEVLIRSYGVGDWMKYHQAFLDYAETRNECQYRDENLVE